MNDLRSQLYYSIIVFLVALALMIAQQARSETPSCEETLELCDKSEAACQGLVKEQRALVQAQDELLIKLTRQRNEALQLAQPSTSFPWYVGIVLGIAGGVILTRGIR